MTANTQIMVPSICEKHRHLFIIRALRFGPDDPWMAGDVIAGILLFRWAAYDERILKRTAGDATNLSLVLNELGCLACWDYRAARETAAVLRKGLSHAAKVSRGEIPDPDFRVPENGKPPPAEPTG